MKENAKIAQRGAVFLCIVALFATNDAQHTQPLVQFSDLHYLGAFKLPDAWSSTRDDPYTFRYAQGPIAFNPHQGGNSANPPSLFVACYASARNIAEINIPTPVVSLSSNINELPVAAILQHCADQQAGASQQLSFAMGRVGGLLVSGTMLFSTYYDGFPSAGCPAVSHYVKPSLNLSAANVTGGFVVNNAMGGTCFIDGPMAWVPPEWRPLLGNNPAITYQCCTSIISSTSWGPSAFSFNPALLGTTPVNSVALQAYTEAHHTLGQYNDPTPLVFEPPWNHCWNASIPPQFRGLVMPNGTRSALYFTAAGIGGYCYGYSGCTDPFCGSGCATLREHGYPYRFQIMAFDLSDWAAVAAGSKQPWEPVPYAVWPLVPPAMPFSTGTTDWQGGGAAYDPESRRIYWEQPSVYGDGLPIIHVWEVLSAASVSSYNTSGIAPDIICANPNPFNSTVLITITNDELQMTNTDLKIFNVQGELVKDFSREIRNLKFVISNSVSWDASGLPSGTYMITARMGAATAVKRVTLVK